MQLWETRERGGLKGELEDPRGQRPANLKARHFRPPKPDQKGSQWRSLWETIAGLDPEPPIC